MLERQLQWGVTYSSQLIDRRNKIPAQRLTYMGNTCVDALVHMGATDTMPTGDKSQCRASLIEWKTGAQPTHENMMKTDGIGKTLIL